MSVFDNPTSVDSPPDDGIGEWEVQESGGERGVEFLNLPFRARETRLGSPRCTHRVGLLGLRAPEVLSLVIQRKRAAVAVLRACAHCVTRIGLFRRLSMWAR